MALFLIFNFVSLYCSNYDERLQVMNPQFRRNLSMLQITAIRRMPPQFCASRQHNKAVEHGASKRTGDANNQTLPVKISIDLPQQQSLRRQ
jgi:hypothetical protein